MIISCDLRMYVSFLGLSQTKTRLTLVGNLVMSDCKYVIGCSKQTKEDRFQGTTTAHFNFQAE